MRPVVFIDGKEGTTGLQIYERLAGRDDIELLLIDEEKRKDPAERKKCLNRADLAFLCLPDAAAKEAVAMVDDPNTRIIDASTAHRTAPGWAYGFAELSPAHRGAIQTAKRVANPGCHATGFISVVYPLVQLGLLPRESLLSCFSLTGYSGGGKKMIAQYENVDKARSLYSPNLYAMGQSHKHLPEMKAVCGLIHEPVFSPIVDDYYKGMATTVPLHISQLSGVSGAEDVRKALKQWYGDTALVHVAEEDPSGKLYSEALAGKDHLTLSVAGNEQRVTVTALFDNLGKGASGAAIQNMNIMLGFEETKGLNL